MASFKHASLRALNPYLPMGARFNAFIECCSAFGRLAGTGLQPVYDRLGLALGFGGDLKPNEEQLVRAMSLLTAARFRLIHERAEFAAKRKRLRGEMKASATGELYEGLDPLSLLEPRTRPGRT